jgi:hypothetical protein
VWSLGLSVFQERPIDSSNPLAADFVSISSSRRGLHVRFEWAKH